MTQQWQFLLDRGGTFTDIVAKSPEGTYFTHKLLSENPAQYQDAALTGIRQILGITENKDIPTQHIQHVRMGTTVATNALLEKKGEPFALITTKGFGDALRIGYQQRPDLFAIDIQLPDMIYSEVLEVSERILADGSIEASLDQEDTRKQLQQLFDKGIKSIAVLLIHGYQYTQHEKQISGIAQSIGFTQISLSHEISPLIRYIPRGHTTAIDAYLSPILKHYTQHITQHIPNTDVRFMQSNGRLTEADRFNGKDAILSGPAGGIVGMVKTAEQEELHQLIGFDMGGTSTDVCHYDGEYKRSNETVVAGVTISTPMLQIHTVAAGGSSILHFDGMRFIVGPDSAGSYPGPLAYRHNGPLTITDCNVYLGKLQPQYFPALFGENANETLDQEKVSKAFEVLSIETQKTAEATAQGFLNIAVNNMANAIKHISVQRGYNVTNHILCCYGGAGAQHACLVADALGMKKIFLHAYSGVLSAFGMGLADTGSIKNRTLNIQLSEKNTSTIQESLNELTLQLQHEYPIFSYISHKLHCRYANSDSTLTIVHDDIDIVRASFHQQHLERFGFNDENTPVTVESIEVEIAQEHQTASPKINISTKRKVLVPSSTHKVYFNDEWVETPFYQREHLGIATKVTGPAIIIEDTSTVVIEPFWQATVTSLNNLILEKQQQSETLISLDIQQVDPIQLEIFNKQFMNIAEQMGSVLENTAVSVNIKERLDFSCAIFDPDGQLVANAPHMPVHLGSMSESIKSVIAEHGTRMQEGDAYVSNDPYNGGTHLPDITVILPVFQDQQAIFYVAARGHHADIGGTTPGSIPPDSQSIHEEGILIDNIPLLKNGILLEETIRELLASTEYPSRKIDFNIADLKAQLAACQTGTKELQTLISIYSYPTVAAYMRFVQNNAEECVRRVIEKLHSGNFQYCMDDGTCIKVAIHINHNTRSAVIDFTGSSTEHPGNFNAPVAITKAAVLYVFRCLVDDDIPLNEGCLKPLNIIIPEKSILNPSYPAAVVAGNVETSQLIVDCLFGALGTMAAAQGTMNNVTWGNAKHQYYETLCGGAGASANSAGTDAVHTHMTNSRLTDPEILETRFPVILDNFSIRKNSGGAGQRKGGNGIIRKTRFLEDMTISLVTGRRQIPPYGIHEGYPGKQGRNALLKKNTTQATVITSIAKIDVQPGDTLIIETPGGGGYGKPDKNQEQ
ncbi:MAG: 5-oxoprolinase (EC [uncultured Thiotrichaceae bacterium]|uniref:5-oxoprolinase (EC) n=1 Tax=uncultured Thiotrichaceae bacterium TaxID=298394 RepID=A0A6S6U558_9GAMM|nr:MAG: 5-oxoprolinase (EC [uncultured Thiotrichaceae bacterium]